MTVLTVNINDKKDKKALEALKAVIEALGLNYDLDDDAQIDITDQQKLEILRREEEYKSGRMELYSMEEVKASLNYKA